MINVVDNPEMFDVFWLGGVESPGVCKLSAPTRDEGWELQQAKGESGGETVHNGTKLIEFEAELTLWKDPTGLDDPTDHFARWETLRGVMQQPIAKNAPKALDFYHPQTAALGIASVVVKSWTEPAPRGDGAATVKIKFLQYAPPKPKAAGKPKGSTASGGGKGGSGSGEGADPNADVKKKIADKTEEFNSL